MGKLERKRIFSTMALLSVAVLMPHSPLVAFAETTTTSNQPSAEEVAKLKDALLDSALTSSGEQIAVTNPSTESVAPADESSANFSAVSEEPATSQSETSPESEESEDTIPLEVVETTETTTAEVEPPEKLPKAATETIPSVENIVAEGTYADGGVWTLDSEGVLTLNGGTLTTTSLEDVPWQAHRKAVKKVVFASEVTGGKKLAHLFEYHSSLTTIENLKNLNTTAVESMHKMFYHCGDLKELDLSNFNTANVSNMSYMFYKCEGLKALDVSNFNTINVSDMYEMFYQCSGLEVLDVSNFNTAKVSNMRGMFSGCSGLIALDLSNFNTAEVSGMSNMFYKCSSLQELDLSNFNTAKVSDMYYMFSGCSGLKVLDLGNFNTAKVSDMRYMFTDSSVLNKLTLGGAASLSTDVGLRKTIWYTVTEDGVDTFGATADLLTDHNNKQQTRTYYASGAYHLVTFTSQGEGLAAQVISHEEKLQVPMEPKREGYVFKGWSTSESEGELFDFEKTAVTNDLTLYAQWGRGYDGEYSDGGYWSLDDEGTLTLQGGTLTTTSLEDVPWKTHREAVKTVVFASEVKGGESLAYLFREHNSLTAIENLKNLNTENVGDMSNMFSYCSELEALDVSGFNTANVRTMGGMFGNCKRLKTLDLSIFNTENVSDMSFMFTNCSGLEVLDVSKFNTENVSDMSFMFANCSGLETLDLSNFNTVNVSNMWHMFFRCSGLKALDLSNFNTANVRSMGSMFHGCSGLKELDVSNFNTENVSNMSNMFNGCSSLQTLDLSSFNTNPVSDTGYMLSNCGVLNTLTMGGAVILSSGAGLRQTIWYTVTEDGVATFDTTADLLTDHKNKQQTRTYYASGAYHLVTFTSQGEELATQVISHEEKLPAPTEPTRNGYTFIGWSTSESEGELFDFEKTVVTSDLTLYAQWERIPVIVYDGEYNDGGYWSLDDEGTLTLQGGTLTTTSQKDVPWQAHREDVKKVVFGNKVTGGESLAYLFAGHRSLTAIENLKNLNTTAVKSMSYMFYNCSGLKTLDVSKFNTDNVIYMSYMFYNCSGLKTLDVSNFNTENVIKMSAMFRECIGLEALDVSKFNTEKVSNMSGMFNGCRGLKALDISNFNTEKVSDMSDMFSGCSELEALDVSGFDTANVSNLSGMFYGCSGLKALDVSKFNTDNVIYMNGMFINCRGLKVLDVSKFNTDNVIYMNGMFINCIGLEALDVSKFNTEKVSDMSEMFSGCSELEALDVSGFDTANVSNMSFMFNDCSELEALDVSGFDTANVSNMSYMFAGCSGLKALDVSKFNTEKVRKMNSMFRECSGLEALDVSNFDATHVIAMDLMFYGCTNIDALDLSSFSPLKGASSEYMFYGVNKAKLTLSGDFTLQNNMGLVNQRWYTTANSQSGPGIGLIPDTGKLIEQHNNSGQTRTYYPADHYPFDSFAHAVAFDSQGGTEVAAQIINYGEVAVEPVTRRPGYRFVGWYMQPYDGATPYDFKSPVIKNQTLYAHWEENNSYTLTIPEEISLNDARSVTVSAQSSSTTHTLRVSLAQEEVQKDSHMGQMTLRHEANQEKQAQVGLDWQVKEEMLVLFVPPTAKGNGKDSNQIDFTLSPITESGRYQGTLTFETSFINEVKK